MAYSNNQIKKRYHSNRISSAQNKVNRQTHQQLITRHNKEHAPSVKYQKTTKHLAQIKQERNNKQFNSKKVNNRVKGIHHNGSKKSVKPLVSDKMRRYPDKAIHKTYKTHKNKTYNKQKNTSHSSVKNNSHKERTTNSRKTTKHSKRDKH